MNTQYDVYDGKQHVGRTHNANTASLLSADGFRVTAVSGAVAEVGR